MTGFSMKIAAFALILAMAGDGLVQDPAKGFRTRLPADRGTGIVPEDLRRG